MFSSIFRIFYWEDLFVTLFTLTVLARDLVRLLKLVTENVYEGMWNLFKIDNKGVKKEHHKDMFTVHQKNTWKKSLGNIAIC